MALSSLDLGELVEDWTLLDEERKQVGDKRGPARLGFTLLLKFYTRFGQLPARPGGAARRGGGFRGPPGAGRGCGAGVLRVVWPDDRVAPRPDPRASRVPCV